MLVPISCWASILFFRGMIDIVPSASRVTNESLPIASKRANMPSSILTRCLIVTVSSKLTYATIWNIDSLSLIFGLNCIRDDFATRVTSESPQHSASALWGSSKTWSAHLVNWLNIISFFPAQIAMRDDCGIATARWGRSFLRSRSTTELLESTRTPWVG